MPDVIISFDTEDFATPQAWDAQQWWADELHARGITGQFQCVAQLIRTLKRRGRDDVLAAFARHDVGYHTNYHSVPPVHPAGVAGKSLADGFAEIVSTFSRVPVSFAAPGRAWTAPTLIAMAMLGIKTWCNPTFLLQRGRPTWYCGLMAFQYDMAFDKYFPDDEAGDSQADRFLRQFDEYAREAGDDGVLTLYSHPTRLVTSAFWDRPYFAGADVPMDKLPPAPLRPPAQVQQLKDRVRRILDGLQSRRDVRFTTYAAAYAQRTRRPEDRRDLPALLAECGLKPGQEGDLALDDASQRAATVRERLPWMVDETTASAAAPDPLVPGGTGVPPVIAVGRDGRPTKAVDDASQRAATVRERLPWMVDETTASAAAPNPLVPGGTGVPPVIAVGRDGRPTGAVNDASQRAATVRERSSPPDQPPSDRPPATPAPASLPPDALWTNTAPYKWGVIPPDVDRQALIQQARQLAWTGRLT